VARPLGAESGYSEVLSVAGIVVVPVWSWSGGSRAIELNGRRVVRGVSSERVVCRDGMCGIAAFGDSYAVGLGGIGGAVGERRVS